MRTLLCLVAAAITATFGQQVCAQSYPTKPPRLYVGFVPGGGVDQTARITAAKLGELWGHPVTVENRTGAGGTIAADITSKAAPDGYTLVLCSVWEVQTTFFSMHDCITGQRSDHLCAVFCENFPLARVYRSLRRPVEADFDAL